MKLFRGYLILAAALALSACMGVGTGGGGLVDIPPGPSEIADQYTFDEVGVIKLNRTVEIAARAGTALIRSREVKGDRLATARWASGVLRTALEGANKAYAAGNRESWTEFIGDLSAAMRTLNSLKR